MPKPELLMPAGNVESFYAAIEGGADAIYLGLKGFNARGRAANFNPAQLQAITHLAAKRSIKVYVTLNTVIKNNELNDLLDTLFFLSKLKIAAVIIQDWGTLHLIKQYFPSMVAHASTQMANHNSLGTLFSKKAGFNRVILARELTWPELTQIQKSSPVETEIFVHGALCYSFSGMCHFSSYLGGAGANRGLCTQPCRRFYMSQGNKKPFFSLKDNQLLEWVPKMAEIGVNSLKIEGRLKSGEYVYQVTRAYRETIDHPEKEIQTLKLAIDDLSRPKTQWFMGQQVKEAITADPNTGISIGKITQNDSGMVSFTSSLPLRKGNRMRFRTDNDSDQNAFVIENFQFDGQQTYTVKRLPENLKTGTEIYLTAYREKRFRNDLETSGQPQNLQMPQTQKKSIIQKIRNQVSSAKPAVFVRIDQWEWLDVLDPNRFDYIIMSLPWLKWPQFIEQKDKYKKLFPKLWIELPGFISERKVNAYKKLCGQLSQQGLNRFVVSHLSQSLLLPKGSHFAANEFVYAYNDASVQWIKSQGAQWFMSPVENEYENLLTGASRDQIIPVYFYPKLFYSRMPVNIPNKTFTDERKQRFHKKVVNGMTIVVPDQPVSITQYANKLRNKGFNRFLVDLSFQKPSADLFSGVLDKLKKSEPVQPSTGFNFKKGLR